MHIYFSFNFWKKQKKKKKENFIIFVKISLFYSQNRWIWNCSVTPVMYKISLNDQSLCYVWENTSSSAYESCYDPNGKMKIVESFSSRLADQSSLCQAPSLPVTLWLALIITVLISIYSFNELFNLFRDSQRKIWIYLRQECYALIYCLLKE